MQALQCYTESMFASSASSEPPGSDVHADPTAHEGRRDRKKHETRRALRDAALKLVAERGFAQVTVEDIAEAADVATRTFFNYFPSKESAVIGADPDRIEGLRSELLARPADESPLRAVSKVALVYASAIDQELDDLGEGREAWFRRFCIVRSDPDLHGAYVAHVGEVERALAAALAERMGTDPAHDPYPSLVTATVLAAARVAGLYWSANGGKGSLAQVTEAALDTLAEGLPVEKSLSGALHRARGARRPHNARLAPIEQGGKRR